MDPNIPFPQPMSLDEMCDRMNTMFIDPQPAIEGYVRLPYWELIGTVETISDAQEMARSFHAEYSLEYEPEWEEIFLQGMALGALLQSVDWEQDEPSLPYLTTVAVRIAKRLERPIVDRGTVIRFESVNVEQQTDEA